MQGEDSSRDTTQAQVYLLQAVTIKKKMVCNTTVCTCIRTEVIRLYEKNVIKISNVLVDTNDITHQPAYVQHP